MLQLQGIAVPVFNAEWFRVYCSCCVLCRVYCCYCFMLNGVECTAIAVFYVERTVVSALC